MKPRKLLFLTLILSSVVFSIMTWPLPKFVTTGIPSTPLNTETRADRVMMHGDHLQLMYRFWLFADFFTPNTPFFHNLYEFNTGDDAERYVPRAHHFPFPLTFKAGELIKSRAFGWNLTMFLTVWLAWFSTWLLLRRLGGSDLQSGFASAISMIFPYRWITLCGGSPTGFGMLWTPIIWLGIEMALHGKKKSSRIRGGMLSAIAVLFAAFCDSHVFYFTLLYTPFFVIISLLIRGEYKPAKLMPFLWSRGLRLIPLATGFALSIAYGLFKKTAISAAGAGGKRSFDEVKLYSYNWRTYFFPDEHHHSFIGILMASFLVIGTLFLIHRFLKKKISLPYFAGFSLLMAGIGAAVLLGYGTEGPFGFAPILFTRKFVPMYEMIRQPIKIFCYMPLLIAVASMLIFKEWNKVCTKPWARYAPLPLFLVFLMSYNHRIVPGICILATEQGAYAAVAEDSRSQNKEPRLFILPFWPGNDASSSIYEHYVSLYRIKMMNGYSPVPAKSYSEDLFNFYNSMNQGLISEEQLDDLLDRGIEHIILHEELFPKKVSPRPQGFTLKALFEHPRIKFLAKDQGAWAFTILKEGNKAAITELAMTAGAITRMFQAERARAPRLADETASRGQHIRLRPSDDKALLLRSTTGQIEDLSWRIRLRGTGSFYLTHLNGQQIVSKKLYTIDHSDWQWMDISPVWLKEFGTLSLFAQTKNGQIDFDVITFQTGPDWDLAVGESRFIPANAFSMMHSYSVQPSYEVIADPDRSPATDPIEGSFPPLLPGHYSITLKFSSDAPSDTHVGGLYSTRNGELYRHQEVHVGQPARIEIEVNDNLPQRYAFHFNRTAPMKLQGMELKRIK